MTLSCKLVDGSTKDVVISFKPPLKGYEEAEPRLLEMKALSQEGLGKVTILEPLFRNLHRSRL
jgi:hypothetical protein